MNDQDRTREELQNLAASLLSVREEECKYLARELHDNLGQLLTAMRLDLAWLGRHLPRNGDDPKTLATLAKVRDLGTLVDEVSTIGHRVSIGLRPTGIDEMGLCSALEAEAAQFTERTGIECTVQACSRPRCSIASRASIPLFRIVQEALTNIVNHAGATAVEISCTRAKDRVSLRVADNGHGIDPAKERSPDSLGLIGMRERARSVGGRFTMSAVPGEGTVIQVSVPVDEEEESPMIEVIVADDHARPAHDKLSAV